MWPMTHCLSVGALRADAIFTSGLQRRDEPSASQVRQAVAAAIQAFGYTGCAERVAQEFGDHPETAAIRMRWARFVAREVFADSASAGRWWPGRGPGQGDGVVSRYVEWLDGREGSGLATGTGG